MIIIVGCGYLGSYLAKEIVKNTKEPLTVTSRSFENRDVLQSVNRVYCDVTDVESVKRLYDLCHGERLTVFYLAACHDIDYISENPEEARKVNIQGLENFIGVFKGAEKLFFASTDCVYGEGKGYARNFSETDSLNPINEYGRQKSEAERIVLNNGYTVLRFPFMLGPSLIEKPHFYDRIFSSLLSGDSIELIDGMKRSAISFSQAAELTYALSVKSELPQIVNVCADNVLGKYEIGCMLAERTGVSKDSLKRISENEAEGFFKEKRASCIAMDNSLLKSLLGIEKIQLEV